MMNRFLLLVGMMITGFSQGDAQAPVRSAFQQKADSLVQDQMKKYGIAGAGVAVFSANEVLLQGGFGMADLKTGRPIQDQTVFRLASISKVFTALAIMQLIDQGKIRVEAPVSMYLPDFNPPNPQGYRDICISDLLTHTSGLIDVFDNGDCCSSPKPMREVIALLNAETRSLPPGLRKIYSNAGYALLGCVIEAASGKSYSDYVQQHLLTPLQMEHSSVSADPRRAADRVKGYLSDSTEYEMPALRDLAAGAIEGSLPDMVRFGQMLLNQGQTAQGVRIVSEKSFRQMAGNQLGHVALTDMEQFGYGLFIKPLGTDHDADIGPGIGHAGNMRNHHSLLMVYPKINLGILILSNSEQGNTFSNVAAIGLVRQYLRYFLDMNPAKANPQHYPEGVLQADGIDHQRISGIYGGGGADYVHLKRINDKKLRFRQAGNTLVLRRQADHTYTVKYRLLKCIPVKVKQVMFAFRELDGDIYMKTIDTQRKTATYISKRDPDTPHYARWESMAGHYEILNLCPGNTSMQPVRLVYQHRKLFLYRQDPLTKEEDSIGFYTLGEQLAVADGIDRGAGANLRILPNGHLYYSGFEMKKTGR
jgi:CubicO group peptidase (beta-lactamase class C family)